MAVQNFENADLNLVIIEENGVATSAFLHQSDSDPSGGTPGGSDTQVQFNDGGTLGGDANLTWDKTHTQLTVKGTLGGGGVELGPGVGVLNTGFSTDNDKTLRLVQFSNGDAVLKNLTGGGSGSSRLNIIGPDGAAGTAGSWNFENLLTCSGKVDCQDKFGISFPSVPANASSAGVKGEIAWDSGFIYVCVDTNTWKRTAIATWP